MKIDELMSKKIIVIEKDKGIIAAAQKMKEFDIGFLPVVEKQKVIGVITDRDIVIRGISNNNDELLENSMTKNIISINSSSDINELLELMKQEKIKRVIVEKDNKMVGIISLSDLLNTNIDVIDTIKTINIISKNTDVYKTEIDEFYL